MIRWLEGKLDAITREFLDGGGYGAVYEAQYLAYLECLIALRGEDPWQMWEYLKKVCIAQVPDGEKPTTFASRITDRKNLVEALEGFRRDFENRAHDAEVPRSEGAGSMNLLDLLTGDDE